MNFPKRSTRRLIALWTMALISIILIKVLFFSELGPQNVTVLSLMVPTLGGVILGFMTEQAFSDHSERKNDHKG